MLWNKLLNAGSAAAGPPSYVNGATFSTTGTTSTWTGTLPTGTQAGDLVVVTFATASKQFSTIGSVANNSGQDWIPLASSVRIATSAYTSIRIFYSYLSSGFSTTLTFGQTNGTSNSATVSVQVFRNAGVPVSLGNLTFNNTVRPSFPTVTASNSDSFLAVIGAGAHTYGAQSYSTTGLSDFRTIGVNSTYDSSLGVGYIPSGATVTPSQYNFSSSDSATFSSIGYVVEIPPA